MPKVAIADTFSDWDKLLAAAAEHAETVPGLKPRLAALTAINEKARALEALRLRLKADRQVATQDLHATREEGKDLAMAVRSLLKASFGADFEGLVAFNVRPRRNRRKTRFPQTVIPPSEPEK